MYFLKDAFQGARLAMPQKAKPKLREYEWNLNSVSFSSSTEGAHPVNEAHQVSGIVHIKETQVTSFPIQDEFAEGTLFQKSAMISIRNQSRILEQSISRTRPISRSVHFNEEVDSKAASHAGSKSSSSGLIVLWYPARKVNCQRV